MQTFVVMYSLFGEPDRLVSIHADRNEAHLAAYQWNRNTDSNELYWVCPEELNMEFVGVDVDGIEDCIAQLLQDAARYRWLRKQPNDTDAPRIDVVHWVPGNGCNDGEGIRLVELDLAIDQAIAKDVAAVGY